MSGTVVTRLAAILASVVPLTAVLQTWAQETQEHKLEELKLTEAISSQREHQQHELRVSYLERMKTPDVD